MDALKHKIEGMIMKVRFYIYTEYIIIIINIHMYIILRIKLTPFSLEWRHVLK